MRNKPPIIALRDSTLSIGDKVLFNEANVSISIGDRICLVGRNGSGKSSLLKVLAGDNEIDSGQRFVQPGSTIGYLPQDPIVPEGVSVRRYVSEGVTEYEKKKGMEYQVDSMLLALSLDGAQLAETLSGGETRRLAIARALLSTPDILLLDEPTNHLDLPTIEWLEKELLRYRGGLLLISHDRAFLRRLTNKTYWIDRTVVRRNSSGFAEFSDWSEKVLEDEETEFRQLNKKIAEETRWLREGLTARRKRNMGRVRQLQELNQKKIERLRKQETVEFTLKETERSGQLVLQARNISKTYLDNQGDEKIIARDFSTIIKRRDRIGLIGKNGAGKTTLLRMLIGEEKPESGKVKIGVSVVPVYYDQKRESLDLNASLWSTLCPGGGDIIDVGGRDRHVVSYLRDFLFEEKQALSQVKTLSGGERNRLLLARLFSRQHNLVVLDEPTNDLDVETLELLEEVLSDYDGTIILVSHDRDFLDRVVTSTIALEGNGFIEEYPGGYSTYLKQSRQLSPSRHKPQNSSQRRFAGRRGSELKTKLTYKEQRELDGLPKTISDLEAKQSLLQEKLSDSDFYLSDPKKFTLFSKQLSDIKGQIESAEDLWISLEERKEELETKNFRKS
ncbi:ATP-binding cassette domain-containing protein [Rhodospirillaceae bacterium]|nr:ATP-binding cassette domain-containing protein [Rhodospirillaceae bacterium]MDC0998095.1 ATP-binding cassette domain-containing protein [Alphaproteobacteria bacterium]MDC1442587.1 ATP-binding cassette domain-containing protein [Rhodospirillaceae bacterium]